LTLWFPFGDSNSLFRGQCNHTLWIRAVRRPRTRLSRCQCARVTVFAFGMCISGRSMPFAESASLSDQLTAIPLAVQSFASTGRPEDAQEFRSACRSAAVRLSLPLVSRPSIFDWRSNREFTLTLNDQRADALRGGDNEIRHYR
jgi:hypothetical protein